MNTHIRQLQTGLRGLGHDPGPLDGIRGRRTETAVLALAQAWDLVETPPPLLMPAPPVEAPKAPAVGVFNSTSEALLEGVHPDLVRVLRAARSEIVFDVIEGLRTRERQEQLVAQGASKTMNSRHLTGHAADLWPIDPLTQRRVTHRDPKERDRLLWLHLRKVAAAVKTRARALGVPIEWGGDWGWDAPHFQLPRSTHPA